MRFWCRGDGGEGRKRCSVKRHRNVYTRGGSGSRNPFSCTVTRTRLSRVLRDWFSSGAFVILSSTSSSQNFLVPRTPGREEDKEDTVGCVFTSVPRFSCGWSACRTTYVRIFWMEHTGGSQWESRAAQRRLNAAPPTVQMQRTKVSASPMLFDDFLTGQITQSVLSRSGQTLCIETSRGILEKKKEILPLNCLENDGQTYRSRENFNDVVERNARGW